MPDEIIEELWGIKDSIAREHGNDVRKLAAYLQSKKDAKSAPGLKQDGKLSATSSSSST